MADAENVLPPSKKRAAGREISRDNPGLDDDEEGSTEQEAGTFKKASDEVLASRKIVRVRRNQNTSSSDESTPSSNPFAGIRLVPPAAPPAVTTEVVAQTDKVLEGEKGNALDEVEKGKSEADKPLPENTVVKESTENKENNVVEETKEPVMDSEKPAEDKVSEGDKTVTEDEENTEAESVVRGGEETSKEDKKDNSGENTNPNDEGSSLSSFQQLSSTKNAFTGFAGTGFSTSTFTFGPATMDGSASNNGKSLSFGFGLSHNGSSSVFGTTGASIGSKSEGSSFPAMQEVPVETGEENETTVFTADSVLFEFLDGSWKERGKGEVKVNVSAAESERARLIMRTRGNLRLVLNASLYPDIKLTNMDKRGITFACVNSAGESHSQGRLSTFALKFKDGSVVEEFRNAVTAHKGKLTTATANSLKTPENSPKASDE